MTLFVVAEYTALPALHSIFNLNSMDLNPASVV